MTPVGRCYVANSSSFAAADQIRIGGIAVDFHETYERLAPQFGWETQEVSRVDWKDLPDNQKRLMEAVIGDLLDRMVIRYGI